LSVTWLWPGLAESPEGADAWAGGASV